MFNDRNVRHLGCGQKRLKLVNRTTAVSPPVRGEQRVN